MIIEIKKKQIYCNNFQVNKINNIKSIKNINLLILIFSISFNFLIRNFPVSSLILLFLSF